MAWIEGDGLTPTNLNRNLPSALAISVKDSTYSAAGDGATDDTVSLRSAFMTGAANIFLPSGTYLVSSVLTLGSNQRLYGVGEGSVIKAASGHTSTILTNANSSGNSNIVLENFTVDGNKLSRATGQHLIHLTCNSGSTNENLMLRRLTGKDSPALGFIVSRTSGAEVSNNHVYGNDRDGITFYFGCRNVKVVDNRIHHCGDDFIGLNAENETSSGHSMMDFVVARNFCGPSQVSAGAGIAVRGAARVVVADNVVQDGREAGISISNWNTSPAEDVLVTGNVILNAGAANSGNDGHGINIVGARATSSLSGAAGCHRVTIRGNNVVNPRTTCVRAIVSASSGTITQLAIEGNTLSCGTLSASGRGILSDTGPIIGYRIVGNSVMSAQDRGIFLDDATRYHRQVVIANNIVLNSGLAGTVPGIEVRSAENVTITGNHATDTQASPTQQYGIRISNISNAAVISGNYVLGNATGGINVNNAPTNFERAHNIGDV